MSRVEIFVVFVVTVVSSYQSGVADCNAISICRHGENEEIVDVDIAFCCAALSLFNPKL